MDGSANRIAPPPDAAEEEAHDAATMLGFHLTAMPSVEDMIPEAARNPELIEAVETLLEEAGHLRAALARAYQRIASLENIADRDSLVPVFNRRAFMRELARTIAFCNRYGTVASVVFLDINGMKQINDTFGHGAGDSILVAAGELLAGEIRQSDVIGRLGGDEFGVILMQAGRDAAMQKAASLARLISETPIRLETARVRLTAAHGVHTLRESDTPLSALQAADQAMYRDKERQRGRKGRRSPRAAA